MTTTIPPRHLDTLLIHAGEPDEPIEGAVNLPIFQSSTFVFAGQSDYHDLHYIRLSNTPNHQVLHAKLAAVEGAEAALVTASGMAAVTATLLALLPSGQHLLAHECLYGGTHTFIGRDAPRLGITADLIDATDSASWSAALRPSTRVIFVETITNPLVEVADLEAVVAFAQAHELVSVIDNTFATPINCRPHDLGFDLVIESCTKYLNGHTDIVAGSVSGSAEHIRRINRVLSHLGGCLDPHACFLLRRGLQTLGLRMQRHNENALRLARLLESDERVTRVRYPMLDSHPHVDRARRLLKGGGGALSFEVAGGAEVADRLMSELTLATSAPSLGGVETLITRPATTSHVGMSPAEREQAGIVDGLVRVAVGLEHPDDLCEDFTRALASL